VRAPDGNGYTKIYSTGGAFAALKADGSITAWGSSYKGGTGAPSDNGYTKIYSTGYAFAALKADGSITAWGASGSGGSGAAPPVE
jgi:aryl-alcohol dehydrogenase-like predicted oxidoreductase